MGLSLNGMDHVHNMVYASDVDKQTNQGQFFL